MILPAWMPPRRILWIIIFIILLCFYSFFMPCSLNINLTDIQAAVCSLTLADVIVFYFQLIGYSMLFIVFMVQDIRISTNI